MVTGIVAEYNIFHNGHKYQIDEIKKNSDAVIAVMSGCFVQRGDVAIIDKWSRAEMALKGGCDLVLELPVCCALNAAQNFAAGAVGMLNAAGIVDNICFGSESGDIDVLIKAAQLMENETEDVSDRIKTYMSEGMVYPAALSKAYDGVISVELLSEPNNILAIEYIRSLIRTNSKIKPVTLRRCGASHHGSETSSSCASASAIRGMIRRGEDISHLTPHGIKRFMPYDISRLDSAIIANLRKSSPEELCDVNEMTEGLENRILQSAMKTNSFFALVDSIKSKRYTESKIRRVIISSLIGFKKDIFKPTPDYLRVLGMNETGMKLLRKIKSVSRVPIITKTADFKSDSPQFNLDLRATDIAALCAPDSAGCMGGADFTRSPVIL